MVEKDVIHACFNGMLMVSEGDKVEIIRSRHTNVEPRTMMITEIRNLSAGRHCTSWVVEGDVLSPILRGIVKNISVVTKLGSMSKDTVTRFEITDIARARAKEIPRDDLIYLDCDILVPAAVSNVITAENASRINARLVVEGANIPTTKEAEEILFNRGILVLPDLLVNAGGVIGSYVEYLGKNAGKAFDMIESKIGENTKLVMEKAIEDSTITPPRKVAMEIAMERVSEAMRKR